MASLKELQHAIAARLTDRRCWSNKESGQDLLANFDANELRQSRETLIRKRLSQMSSLMPKTQIALPADFSSLCREFIDQHHFQGFQAPQLDAIHFAKWLNRRKAIAPWALEIAAWEALQVELSMNRVVVRVRRFKYDVLSPNTNGIELPVLRSLWIVIRVGGWGFLRRF